MIRVGIIGTGGAGHSHAEHYSTARGAKLAACFDTDRSRRAAFAERFGVEHSCGSVEELLDRVDAVSIAAPDPAHAPIALEALQRGVHVLCEKPLTTTMQDAVAVADAAILAGERGVIHMINFSKRNHAPVRELFAIVRRGDLGEITAARGGYDQSWLVHDAWGGWQSDGWRWRLTKPSGSLIDLGVHVLDLLVGAVGHASELRCSLHTAPKPTNNGRIDRFGDTPLDSDDIAHVELQLECGAVAHLTQSRWASGHHDRVWLEVFGTEGAVLVDLERHPNRVLTCIGRDDLRSRTWTSHERPGLVPKQHEFVSAIQTGTPAEPSVIHGARIQGYLDAAIASAESGAWRPPTPIAEQPVRGTLAIDRGA